MGVIDNSLCTTERNIIMTTRAEYIPKLLNEIRKFVNVDGCNSTIKYSRKEVNRLSDVLLNVAAYKTCSGNGS